MELPGFDTAKEVQAAIKRAQDLMRPYRQGGRSLVDELLPNAVLRPRVSKYVLDTSAVLALLDRERGADRIGAAVAESVIGTVNLAEVHSKLTERGKAGRQALAEILAVMDAVVVSPKNTPPSPAG